MNVLKIICCGLTFTLTACASSAAPEQIMQASIMNPVSDVPTFNIRHPDMKSDRKDASATSLWTSSPQSLFGDRRASVQGDILTVTIEIDDQAELNNSTNTNRQNDRGFNLGAFFGLPETVNRVLPAGASLSPGVDISGSRSTNGTGSISRGERITLRLAAQVTDVASNGYLQITGSQRIMVNSEIRQLMVSGLVRPQDISRVNVITYDKIANAKIYYGGEGSLSHIVKLSKGQKWVDKIVPF
jgi:flagellar L-ring protein precursor FlgH